MMSLHGYTSENMSDQETRDRRRRKMKQANKKHRRSKGDRKPQDRVNVFLVPRSMMQELIGDE